MFKTIKWWTFTVIIACFIFGLLAFIPVPLYDGVFYYNNDLVHFQQDSKVALSYFFNIGLENEVKNNITPTFQLKPVGIALLILIHLGLPAIIGLRIKYHRERNHIRETEH